MEDKTDSLCFSFKYLTNQKKFNFSYFKHDKQAEEKAKSYLLDKLIFLSQNNWKQIENLSKNVGFEYIPAKEVKVKIPENFKHIKNLMIFRFDEEHYRIIGIKENDDNIFYILGFDFDYEAYNHEK